MKQQLNKQRQKKKKKQKELMIEKNRKQNKLNDSFVFQSELFLLP